MLAERGIDIRGQRSKHPSEFLSEEWDWVLTVCETAAASYPTFPDPVAIAGDQDARLAALSGESGL